MRRSVTTLIAAALILVLAGPAAAQGPPETIDLPVQFAAVDGDYLVVVNVTAEDLCAGVQSGTAPARVKETGKGALVVSVNTTVYAELWRLGPGDFCEDEDGTLLGTGSLRLVATDNDYDVSGTRTNSFGDVTHGVIRGAGGQAWRVHAVWRAQITQDGEFTVLVDRTSVRATR